LTYSLKKIDKPMYIGLQLHTSTGPILLRALISKIIDLLTYINKKNGHLINMGKFYFEDVQF
jgi:hypothetical protein